jgi:hypothetical protein
MIALLTNPDVAPVILLAVWAGLMVRWAKS